jgi:hypothetical protein
MQHPDKIICPYCETDALLKTGFEIFPHKPDLYDLHFWECSSCDARVGTHINTITPMGKLANVAHRRLKKAAHRAFDPVWQSNQLGRNEAYFWLAQQLGIEIKDCHIGLFDEATCQRVIDICTKYAKHHKHITQMTENNPRTPNNPCPKCKGVKVTTVSDEPTIFKCCVCKTRWQPNN